MALPLIKQVCLKEIILGKSLANLLIRNLEINLFKKNQSLIGLKLSKKLIVPFLGIRAMMEDEKNLG